MSLVNRFTKEVRLSHAQIATCPEHLLYREVESSMGCRLHELVMDILWANGGKMPLKSFSILVIPDRRAVTEGEIAILSAEVELDDPDPEIVEAIARGC